MSSPNQKIPLRQAIADQFEGERLDAEQLRLLHAVAAPPGDRLGSPSRRRWLAAAASVAAAGGLGLWFGRREQPFDNLQALADEVAYTHLSGQALDVTGASIVALRPAFAALGFALLEPPPEPALEGAELVGGRFCSIASVPAVQLRYRGPHGEVSLCQARFDPERHRGAPDMAKVAAPALRHARGVSVSLCHMQGVFLAVAYA